MDIKAKLTEDNILAETFSAFAAQYVSSHARPESVTYLVQITDTL